MFNPVTLQQLPQNLYQLCQILQQASQILQQQYITYLQGDDFEIQHKQDESPVTQADLLVNQFLSQKLGELAEVYPILSEEGQQEERKNWQEFWMIDPLDGTKEFINKTGEFTINLSLICEGDSVISALAVPLKNTIYIVEQGQMAYRWQWQDEQIILSQYQITQDLTAFIARKDQILHVAMSRRKQTSKRSVNYQNFIDYLEQLNVQYETISAGSAYKFCMMLEGEIDIYPRLHPTSEWDTAAGQGLLQSIGGELLTLSGHPFKYNQRDTVENGHFFALRKQQDWAIFQKFFEKNNT